MILLLDGFRDDGPDDGGFAALVGVPNLGDPHRDDLARAVDVVRLALLGLGPVEQHLLHPVLGRIADVNAQQVIRFARCHPVFGRPRVVDGLEYFQFYDHVFIFRLFVVFGIGADSRPLPWTDGKLHLGAVATEGPPLG